MSLPHGTIAVSRVHLNSRRGYIIESDFCQDIVQERRTSIPVLGIDIGTGGSRAIVMADDGSLIASATADHQAFTSERTAWAEQDPADWWRACQQAIRSALSQSGVQPQQIASIGLSGQMHGTVVLDKDGEVLRPSIIWCDQRGEEQCAWLNRTVGARRLLELTCNPALTNFTLSSSCGSVNTSLISGAGFAMCSFPRTMFGSV